MCLVRKEFVMKKIKTVPFNAVTLDEFVPEVGMVESEPVGQ